GSSTHRARPLPVPSSVPTVASLCQQDSSFVPPAALPCLHRYLLNYACKRKRLPPSLARRQPNQKVTAYRNNFRLNVPNSNGTAASIIAADPGSGTSRLALADTLLENRYELGSKN